MTTSAMSLLRDETREEHVATEATELSLAMAAGTVTKPAYKAQLRAYHQIHHALERSLTAAAKDSPGVAAVFEQAGKKTQALSIDLDHLADVVATDSLPLRNAVLATVRFVTQVDPAVLLGALYVLEGSALGALTLLPTLKSGLGLKDDELTYYRGHGAQTRERWLTFATRMDAALGHERDQAVAVHAARTMFEHLREVFDAISRAAAV